MNIRIVHILFSGVFTFILGICTYFYSGQPNQVSPRDGIFFYDSFEDGTLSSWATRHFCCDYSVQITDKVARKGNKSVQFYLKNDDPVVATGKRAELYRPGGINQKIGKEYWYALSIYVDPEFKVDSNGYSILAQWYSRPQRDEGEVSRPPPLSLLIRGDRWTMDLRADTTRIQKTNRPSYRQQIWWERVVPGTWSDFVVHVKWSYKNDGFLKVWKNDTQIVDHQGMNVYNDDEIMLKMGIYKSMWNKSPNRSIVDSRVFYHDEIKIADGSATYRDMSISRSPWKKKTSIIYPIEDAEVRSLEPHNNFGNETVAHISSIARDQREVFLKFDLSSVEGEIDSVFFYARPIEKKKTVSLYELNFVQDDSWREDSITWSTQPQAGRSLGQVPITTNYCYHTLNISQLAKFEHKNDQLLSLKLSDVFEPEIGRKDFRSMHHTREKDIFRYNFGLKVYSSPY